MYKTFTEQSEEETVELWKIPVHVSWFIFPHDACVREECLVEKLIESGLLQVTKGNHYHFRDTVKKHFRRLREESGIDESIFWREYLKHFSEVLERWSQEFQRNSSLSKNIYRLLWRLCQSMFDGVAQYQSCSRESVSSFAL